MYGRDDLFGQAEGLAEFAAFIEKESSTNACALTRPYRYSATHLLNC